MRVIAELQRVLLFRKPSYAFVLLSKVQVNPHSILGPRTSDLRDLGRNALSLSLRDPGDFLHGCDGDEEGHEPARRQTTTRARATSSALLAARLPRALPSTSRLRRPAPPPPVAPPAPCTPRRRGLQNRRTPNASSSLGFTTSSANDLCTRRRRPAPSISAISANCANSTGRRRRRRRRARRRGISARLRAADGDDQIDARRVAVREPIRGFRRVPRVVAHGREARHEPHAAAGRRRGRRGESSGPLSRRSRGTPCVPPRPRRRAGTPPRRAPSRRGPRPRRGSGGGGGPSRCRDRATRSA